jgi:hypothetical protein
MSDAVSESIALALKAALCAVVEEKEELRKERDTLKAIVDDRENCISWHTNCSSCARAWDTSYHDYMRAEDAEKERDVALGLVVAAVEQETGLDVAADLEVAQIARLKLALSALLPLAEWALMQQSPPGHDQALVDRARAVLGVKP